jgi:hypothetical protein
MTAAAEMLMDCFNLKKEGKTQPVTAANINHNNLKKKSIGS